MTVYASRQAWRDEASVPRHHGSPEIPWQRVVCVLEPRFAHVFRERDDKQQNTNQHIFSVCVCLYVCVCVFVCVLCVCVGVCVCV